MDAQGKSKNQKQKQKKKKLQMNEEKALTSLLPTSSYTVEDLLLWFFGRWRSHGTCFSNAFNSQKMFNLSEVQQYVSRFSLPKYTVPTCVTTEGTQ